MRDTKDKELKDRIKVAKKIRKELKHPYLGTEHLMASILELEEYSKLLETTQEEYLKILNEIMGEGKVTKENVGQTPALSNALHYCNTVLEFLEFLFEENEGIGIRILERIKEEEIDRIAEKVSEYYDLKYPLQDLPEYLTNLNAKEYITNPAIGRDSLIEEMEKILLKMNKPNVLLVGKAGVGKTAVVEGLAYRIQKGEVSEKLKDKIVVSVATSTLVSGTKYRGEFEEKVEKLCKYLKEHPRIILFVDEMHTVMGAGSSAEGGATDMANILKPYLARGEIKVIGATTLDEREIITKDSAYNRRFTTLLVKEPLLKTVNKILTESVPKFEKFYEIKIDKKMIEYIVNKSLNLNGELPDKAIDLLENVCADTVWNNDKTFTKKDVERVIETIVERQKQLEV